MVHDINPVFFSLGSLEIRYYGLAYALGLLAARYYVAFIVKNFKLRVSKKDLDDFLLYSILGIVIGGRLGYVWFYDPAKYFSEPLEIFLTYKGGMSFHGGFAGLAAASYIFSRRRGINFFTLSDLIAVSAPIGLFLGRIANFVNGELWGRPTDLPWGVIFPQAGGGARHPSQIYEALTEGALTFLIVSYLLFSKGYIKYPGRLSGISIGLYSLFRIFVENFREPDAHLGYIGGYFTMGQILCVPTALLGLYLIRKSYADRI